MKIVNHVNNPTAMATFFGGFAIEGTPLVLVRDAKHIGVYNAETLKAASLFESRFDIDTNRLSTFSIEREGDSVSIYVLEYLSETKSSLVRKVTTSLQSIFEKTK
jgi:hypothetical protein